MSAGIKRPQAIRAGGIGARVVRGPREDGRWYWQIRLHEGREVVGLESLWASPAEAARRLAELGEAKAADLSPRPAPPPPPKVETVRDALGFWLGHQVQRHEAKLLADDTISNDRAVANRIARVIGDVHASTMSQQVVEDMCLRLSAKLARSTVHFAARSLLTVWRWCASRGLVTSVALKIPELRVVEKQPRPVATWAEFWRAEAAVPFDWPWVMLVTLGLTGCRTAEAARMRWSDLNLTDTPDQPSTLRIGAHADTRNDGGKHPRTIVLRPELVERLCRWRDHVQPRNPEATVVGVGLHSARFWHRRIDWQALGLPRPTGYNFRRLMSQTLMSQALDPAVYQAQMGHSQETAMKHYRQADPQFHRRMLQKVQLED